MAKVKIIRDGGNSRRKPNIYYRDREHLDSHEITALLKGARQSRYPDRDYLLILMGFRHGLRATEICWLNWSNINLAQSRIFIRRAKGSDSGTHPLQPDEVERLSAVSNSRNGEVFLNERGNPFKPPGVAYLIKMAGDRSTLTMPVHTHMLRHSCGYWLAEQGVPTRDIQAYLGHRNIQNTVRYTAGNPERFRNFQWF